MAKFLVVFLVSIFGAVTSRAQDPVRPDVDRGRPRATEARADKYDRGRYKDRFNDEARGNTRRLPDRENRAPRNNGVKADKYDRNQYRDRFNTAANPPAKNSDGKGTSGGGSKDKGGAAAPPAGPKPGGPKPR